MVVAADLDRPIAGIRHLEAYGLSTLVGDQLAWLRHHLSRRAANRGDHASAAVDLVACRHRQKASVQSEIEIAALGDDRIVNRHELGAVGKRTFHLHFVHELGDAVQHVGASEQTTSEIHQLGDGAAVADELENLRGDERHGFGMVQTHAAGEPLLCEHAGLMKREFIELLRREVHVSTDLRTE